MIGVGALAVACSSAPSEPNSTSGAGKSDFIPCLVSDSGGFDDRSFNQLSYEGVQAAAADLGVSPKTSESKSETDFQPNLQSMVDANCSLVVTVGFLLKDATEKAAAANPDVNFAIIDDNEIEAKNVKPMIFDSAQAAFLAGYVAASYSTTGVVGTFGGMRIPTVTIFMDGFEAGVKYYNTQKGKEVKVVGWDAASQNGTFTGGFEANETAKNTAQGLIDQNVDVLMPVGGPIYQSAVQAIRDTSRPVALVGVDADLYESDPSVQDIVLTSALKEIKQATIDVVVEAGKGNFTNTPYVGVLENDGVGIAPFHNFASKVDPGLSAELEEIKKGIIDGRITISSPSSPKI